jgi:hypothetical protein
MTAHCHSDLSRLDLILTCRGWWSRYASTSWPPSSVLRLPALPVQRASTDATEANHIGATAATRIRGTLKSARICARPHSETQVSTGSAGNHRR